ncbi:hypothetical protein [Actinoallomurus sp. CA-142502]|uniref:hypothetical protein n=1 Tax=Actinoallomurus sp. CA-142502 TaxID=3239885 RepID=UPI003D9131BB
MSASGVVEERSSRYDWVPSAELNSPAPTSAPAAGHREALDGAGQLVTVAVLHEGRR